MKIYLLHEIYDKGIGDIDWYNTYPYKDKMTAIEHISNEVNQPLEDLIEYLKTSDEIRNNSYLYKIEEAELV